MSGEPKDSVEHTLVRVMQTINHEYGNVFEEINNKLLDEPNKIEFLSNVLDKIFYDGVYNWGRVVIAISLTRAVDIPVNMRVEMGELVANKLSQWIYDNGGFEVGFVEHFKEPAGYLKNVIWILGTIGFTIIASIL